jgi:hypothetical protein
MMTREGKAKLAIKVEMGKMMLSVKVLVVMTTREGKV